MKKAKCQALVHSDLHLPRGRSHHRRHDYLVSLILLVNITGQGHIRIGTGTFRISEEIPLSHQQLNVGLRNIYLTVWAGRRRKAMGGKALIT